MASRLNGGNPHDPAARANMQRKLRTAAHIRRLAHEELVRLKALARAQGWTEAQIRQTTRGPR